MTFKTQSEYFSEMLEAMRAGAGGAVSESSEPALRLKALAVELEALGAECEWVFRQAFAQTASGEALEMHAALRGLERGAAVSARGVVRFYTDGSAAREVPAGTAVLTADGRRFAVEKAISIAAGETYGDANVVAEEPGAAGNAAAGAVVSMALAPVGVSWCENRAAIGGGCDAESDEALRARVLAAYKLLKGAANAEFYRAAALAVDGVAAASMVPRANGRGTVSVYVAAADGAPSGELVSAVERAIEAEREVAVDVSVLPASSSNSDVQLLIYFESSENAPNSAELSGKVRKILQKELFCGQRLGGEVYSADIVSAVLGAKLDGVRAVKVASPEYVRCAVGQFPGIGSLKIQVVEV